MWLDKPQCDEITAQLILERIQQTGTENITKEAIVTEGDRIFNETEGDVDKKKKRSLNIFRKDIV